MNLNDAVSGRNNNIWFFFYICHAGTKCLGGGKETTTHSVRTGMYLSICWMTKPRSCGYNTGELSDLQHSKPRAKQFTNVKFWSCLCKNLIYIFRFKCNCCPYQERTAACPVPRLACFCPATNIPPPTAEACCHITDTPLYKLLWVKDLLLWAFFSPFPFLCITDGRGKEIQDSPVHRTFPTG